MAEILRATRACINLDALKANLGSIRTAVPDGTAICAAVKANAYGHGVLPVAAALRDSGVEVLGISSPFEGAELRKGGDRGRILLLAPTVPEEIPLSLEMGLELMMPGESYLEALEDALSAAPAGVSVSVHLKVDTGMGRVGCSPEKAIDLARKITACPRMIMAGTTTHFPSADSKDPDDIRYTNNQAERLSELVKQLRAEGINPGVIHAANSGGIALSPQTAFGMVRPGIALYGYGVPLAAKRPLIPVMELKTKITNLKKVPAGTTISYGRTWKSSSECWIATLPIGYADGYPRLLSNRAQVLISGKRYPVAGTVCMDQMMVNLGEETKVRLNDDVILFGPNPDGPDAGELADLIGTISYEITCGISSRLPRIYV